MKLNRPLRFPLLAPRSAPAMPGRRGPAWAWIPFAAICVLIGSGCSKKNVTGPIVPLPPLASVTVSPRTDTLLVGQNLALSATARDTLGVVVGNVPFMWNSTDPAIATVDGNGRVHASSEGTAEIIVAAGGRSDTATIAVIVQRGWFTQVSHTSNDLNGIFFQNDGRTGWAVGAGGRIVSTTDAGANWAVQVSNSQFNLNAVWFTGAQEGWAVGSGGAVLHTLNGGTLWTAVTSNASENLLDVWFATRDTGWVVGTNGLVLRTFNRGLTWQRLQPTAFDLQSVSFSGTLDGWAVGNAGVILGTHDRGLSWFIVQPSITAQPLRAVWRRSASQAWAAGQAGVTPRTIVTTDSTAWELDNSGASNDLQGVCYPDDQIGYAVGFNSGGVGIVLRTDDAGLSWQSLTPNTQFRLKDVFFIDARNGWVVGRNGTILHTSTGGLP